MAAKLNEAFTRAGPGGKRVAKERAEVPRRSRPVLSVRGTADADGNPGRSEQGRLAFRRHRGVERAESTVLGHALVVALLRVAGETPKRRGEGGRRRIWSAWKPRTRQPTEPCTGSISRSSRSATKPGRSSSSSPKAATSPTIRRRNRNAKKPPGNSAISTTARPADTTRSTPTESFFASTTPNFPGWATRATRSSDGASSPISLRPDSAASFDEHFSARQGARLGPRRRVRHGPQGRLDHAGAAERHDACKDAAGNFVKCRCTIIDITDRRAARERGEAPTSARLDGRGPLRHRPRGPLHVLQPRLPATSGIRAATRSCWARGCTI